MAPFTQGKWDLKDVLPAQSGPEFDAILSELNSEVSQFESFRERLPSFSRDDLLRVIRSYERITRTRSRLGSYAYLLFSENTQSDESKVFMDKMNELDTDTANKIMFFDLWWIGLDDSRAESLMPEDDDYRYYLSSIRKLKPHTLDEKTEQAIEIKNITGNSAWINLYDQITNSFTYTVRIDGKTMKDEKGKTRKFVQEELLNLVRSSNPKEREAAYKSLMKKYAENSGTLGEIYKNIVKDWRNENIKLRSYATPISTRNIGNDIPDEAVDVLLSVCRRNRDIFQDFFRIKARFLGTDKMSRYDIYAPLQQSDRKTEYPDAVELVLKTFDSFDENFGRLARNMFEANHVDSEIRSGKMSGAYCMGVSPDTTPYLLVNYDGSAMDVATIAHEAGHGVHFQLASDHSILTSSAPLPMAETASVFGEMVFSEKMTERETDNQVKRDMLVNKLGDIYATIQRQAYFVMFEKEAHKAIGEGATTEDLCKLYLSNLKEQFGDAVSVPKEFQWEWSYIPHIHHTPFYCYAYSFGNLLTLALYDMYKREGESFKPKLFKILSYGGSASPEKILGEVGIDIRSPEFWQGGFNVIRRMVDQLESTV